MAKSRTTSAAVLLKLKAQADPKVRAAMARFGVHVKKAHGISTPVLHKLAREIGTDHRLAQQLWASGIHEARILAGMVDDPTEVTPQQMERWARDFNAWDAVDGSCCHLFVFAAPAWRKALEWSRREPEYVKRAGFALMAYLAVHDKQAPDAKFERLLLIIQRQATDERNFVKKAVNWAPACHPRGEADSRDGFERCPLGCRRCAARIDQPGGPAKIVNPRAEQGLIGV